ncbi:MAG: hypothetical protein C4K47_10505 [Candidatus Thorarchaeota archaeon]|nr:MAG: hypothetical protein C4K47_10505 [Candidatus Thorarchaeota archaeon]
MRIVALYTSLLLVLFAQCLSPASAVVTHIHEHSQQSSGITISIDFGNYTNASYAGINAANVLNATQSIAQVELSWYGDFAFVIAIDGVSNDPTAGLWWQYWVNGQLGPVAANKYELEDNDSIQWRRDLSHFNANEEGQFNYSVLFGASTLGVLTLVFLGILYRRKMRGQ